jgi:hypothetical protein
MYLYILETEEHLNYYLNYLKNNNNYIATTSPAVSEKLKKIQIKHTFYNFNKIYYNLVKIDFKLINKILFQLKIFENKINDDLNLNCKYSIIELNSYYLNYLFGNFWTKYHIYRSLLHQFKKKKFKKIFFLTDIYENKFPSENNNHNFIFALNEENNSKYNHISIIQVPRKNKNYIQVNLKNRLKNLFLYICMSFNNIKNILLVKKNIKILYLDHVEKRHLINQNKILSYDLNIFSKIIENFSTTAFKKTFLKENYENEFTQNKTLYFSIYKKWLNSLKINSDVKKNLKFLQNEIVFFLIIIPKLINDFESKIRKKLQIIKPDFLFTYSNISWIENFIILLAKNHKIKTVYVQHGGLLGTAIIPKNDFFLSKTDFLFTYSKENKFINKNNNIIPTGNIELLKKINLRSNEGKKFSKILYISDGNSLHTSIKRKMTDISLFHIQKKILNFLWSLNKYEISYRPWFHKLEKTGIINHIKENLRAVKIENITSIHSQISRNDLIITDSASVINLYKSLIASKHVFFIYDEKVITYSKKFLNDLKKVAIVAKNIKEIDVILKNIKNEKIFNVLNNKKDKDKKAFIQKYIFGGKSNFNSYHLYNSLINL